MIWTHIHLISQATQTVDELSPESDEFNLFLFSFLVIGLVSIAVLVAIGICLGLFLTIAGGAAVVSGAALTSAIAATKRQNPQTGLMWFVIQLSLAGGALSGFSIGAVYSHLHQLPVWNWSYSGLATLLGASLSAGIGWISVKLWLRVWIQLLQWWQHRTGVDTQHQPPPSP